MRIHITYTGGTIGMIDSPNGLIPGADTRGWLFRLLEDAHMDASLFTFTELDPLIDSSNATPDNWQTMVDDLRAHRDDADAFVVLHGTDTMSYSSAALAYALTDFGKPVIFTGSQHPLGKIESDATANVTGALNAAMSGRFHGVGLFFGHHLFAGNRASRRAGHLKVFRRLPSARWHALARHGIGMRAIPLRLAAVGRRLSLTLAMMLR